MSKVLFFEPGLGVTIDLQCRRNHITDGVIFSQVLLGRRGDLLRHLASTEKLPQSIVDTNLIGGVENNGGFVLDNQIIDSAFTGSDG